MKRQYGSHAVRSAWHPFAYDGRRYWHHWLITELSTGGVSSEIRRLRRILEIGRERGFSNVGCFFVARYDRKTRIAPHIELDGALQ